MAFSLKYFLQKKIWLFVFYAILFTHFSSIYGHVPSISETDANVFGHVTGKEDGSHIPFINIIIEGTRFGAITDITGHYMITNLPEGRHSMLIKGMGYETARVQFEIKEGQSLEINVKIEYRGVDIDEIVITSSPTARGFRYQPDDVYMGEDLQRRSDISFGEMLNGEPGIAMRSMGPNTSRPVIRGLDGDRILILQNGERMGDVSETSAGHAISLDPLSANRVEVVRGPASLLYGSSAIGGVINLLTPDIPDEWDKGSSGVVSLQGASNNNMGAGFGRYTWGDENLAATGRFGYRKAGNINAPGGIIPSTYAENYDGSFGFGFKNDESNGGLNLSLGQQHYGIPEELDDPYEKVEVRIQQQLIQGRLRFVVNDFFDKAQLRMHASRFVQQEIEIGTEDGIAEEEIEIEFNKLNISSTLTLQHRPAGIFDRGAFGLNLYGRKLDLSGENAFTPNEERFNFGFFTFQEIPLAAGLRFQFGGRLDFLRATSLPNLFSDVNQRRDAFVYAGSAGLNYQPSEYLEIGGQVARSHRYPMLEELFANGPHLCAGVYEVGNINLRDEIGYGGDLFAQWTNGSFNAEFALFYNYFNNFIIKQPTGSIDQDSGLPVFEYQADKARLYGGEASIGWTIFNGFKADMGIDYVAGQRIHSVIENLPFIPPLRFSSKLEYDYGKGWVGSRFRAITSQNRVAPQEPVTAGYTLLDLNAGYRLNSSGRHVIILRVQNLFNTEYRDHLSRVEERNYPMPGRNFSLAYRWFF